MSNGVRRTAAAGLKASAGSNVSKKYKNLKRKLGVKGKSMPGSLIEAARGYKKGARKLGDGLLNRPKPHFRRPGFPSPKPGIKKPGFGTFKQGDLKRLQGQTKKLSQGSMQRMVQQLKGISGQNSNRRANDRAVEASRVRKPAENFRRAGQTIKRGVKRAAGIVRSASRNVPKGALRAGGLGAAAGVGHAIGRSLRRRKGRR